MPAINEIPWDTIAWFLVGGSVGACLHASWQRGADWLDCLLFGVDYDAELDRDTMLGLLRFAVQAGANRQHAHRDTTVSHLDAEQMAAELIEFFIREGDLPSCMSEPANPTETR
jgi:hypothetical protein